MDLYRRSFSPLGNETTNPSPHWQPEPSTRGTWSIISTCFITLFLCLWIALHLNIPEHNGKTFWRKFGWLLIGLLAPEFVVYTAVTQLIVALQLTKTMQAIFRQKPESKWRKLKCFLLKCFKRKGEETGPDVSPIEMNRTQSQLSTRRHQWTHVHSFYVVMGGFAFDTSNAKPKFLPHGRSRLTLRVHALEYLAEHSPHLIPDLSEEEIRDKSKADGLAKSIICIQAFWFCMMCVVRLAQQQAISLLELNTFGHAICTLFVYAFWWHKPLDIKSPTLLEGDEAWEICALIYGPDAESRRATEVSRGQKYGDRVITKWTDIFNGRHLAKLRQHRFEPRMILRWDPIPASPEDQFSSAYSATARLEHSESDIQSRTPSAEHFLIKKGMSLFGFRCMDVYTQADWYRVISYEPFGTENYRPRSSPQTETEAMNELHPLPRYSNKEGNYRTRTILEDIQSRAAVASFDRECTLRASDLYRWELVSRAWRNYQPKLHEIKTIFTPRIPNKEATLFNCVCDRIHNMPMASDNLRYIRRFHLHLLTAALPGLLYGGLHPLAWNATFASPAERRIWRCSGILVASSGLIFLDLFHWDDGSWMAFWALVLVHLFAALPSIWGFALIPARVFLFAESCAQVARLPPVAYELPDWSRYYPHIG